MSCSQGDSIRAGRIESYKSMIERNSIDEFENITEHELSYKEICYLYQEVINTLHKKGYKGKTTDIKIYESGCVNHVISIVVKRMSAYDYVHPDTQIARIGAMIQNIIIANSGNMRYINFLKKKVRSNISKISGVYLKPYYSGYYIQDILCSTYDNSDILCIIKDNIDFINSNMESCDIVDIYLDEERMKPSDINIMIGTLNRDIFKDLIRRYQEWWDNGKETVTIKDQDVRASIHLMLQDKEYSKSSINIKISQKDDRWVIGCSLPTTISPYLILKYLYPKIKLNEIYNNSSFMIYDIHKRLDKVCYKDIQSDSDRCRCGNELVYSMVNRKVSRVCSDCLIRSLMGKFIDMK